MFSRQNFKKFPGEALRLLVWYPPSYGYALACSHTLVLWKQGQYARSGSYSG